MRAPFSGLHRSGCGQICGFPVSNRGMACGQVGDGCAQPVHGLGKTPAQAWGWRNCGQVGLAAGFLLGDEGKTTAPAQKSSRDPHPDPPVRSAPVAGTGGEGAAERRNPCAERPVVRRTLGIRVLHRVCTAAGGLRGRDRSGSGRGSFCERWVLGADRCGRKVRRASRGGPAGRGSRRQRRWGRGCGVPVGLRPVAVRLWWGGVAARRAIAAPAGRSRLRVGAGRSARGDLAGSFWRGARVASPGWSRKVPRVRPGGRGPAAADPRGDQNRRRGRAGRVGRTPTSGRRVRLRSCPCSGPRARAPRSGPALGSRVPGTPVSGGFRVRSRATRRAAPRAVLWKIRRPAGAVPPRRAPRSCTAAGRCRTRRSELSGTGRARRFPRRRVGHLGGIVASDYRPLANTIGAYASPAGRSASESISAAR